MQLRLVQGEYSIYFKATSYFPLGVIKKEVFEKDIQRLEALERIAMERELFPKIPDELSKGPSSKVEEIKHRLRNLLRREEEKMLSTGREVEEDDFQL